MNEETIVARATAYSDAAERAAFLDAACGNDTLLRQRVEAALESQARAHLPEASDGDTADLPAPVGTRDVPLDATLQSDTDGSVPDPALPVGTNVEYFGDFELQGEIARGGMGVVYRARQVSLNRMVALKMIRSSRLVSHEEVHRFLAEAEAAANLDHRNIVPIYEVGEHEEQHYFSMKLIEGGSLAQRIGDYLRDARRAAQLMAVVARAVHFAHQSGILHRDLKPGNILVDAGGAPHVTDFGLAKNIEADSSLTQSGQILGTPSYMSPEQARGGSKALTTATDIYSLGAVLYEMLTGHPPFKAGSVMDTLKQVAENEPPAPRTVDRSIDRDLETIALKCLEKEPRLRYGSAEALADDLERWTRGEPITARAATPVERLVKWVRRKPLQAAMGGLVSLFLLTLLIGGPTVAVHQAHMRHEADDLAAQRDALRIVAEENLLRSETDNLYRTEMLVAGRALQSARGRHQAQRLLLNWRPQAAVEDHREWEWYYLCALAWPDNQRIMRGHSRSVQYGAFSPDSKRFYSFGSENVVRIWDVASAEQTGVIRMSPDAQSHPRPFFLAPDNQRVVWAGNGMSSLNIADAVTGETIRTLGESADNAQEPRMVRWSPDGKLIASSAKDKRVRIWDPTSGEPLKTLGEFSGESPPSVYFSPDNRHLAVFDHVRDAAQGENRVLVYDRQKEFEIVAQRQAALWWPAMWSIDRTPWSPDGTRLLIVGDDGQFKIWHPIEERPDVGLEASEDFREVFFIDWNSDGSRVARTLHDGTVRVNDAKTGEEFRRFVGHEGKGRFVAWQPDGSLLASSDSAGNIKLWDLDQSATDPVATLLGHTGQVRWVSWSPDGSNLVSTGTDKTIRIWDLGRPLPGPAVFQAGSPIAAISWDPDGTRIVAASDQLARGDEVPIRVLDTATAEWIEGDRAGSRTIDWGRSGLLASVISSHAIRLWDASGTDTEPIHPTYASERTDIVKPSQAVWSPDGRRLAAAHGGGVTIWESPDDDIRAAEAVTTISSRDDLTWARAVCWSPDGEHLAIAFRGSTQQIEVWDSGTYQRVWQRRRPQVGWSYIDACAWSPDGQRLASGDPDTSIRIWNAATGEPEAVLRGHTGTVNSLDWAPDGSRLASAGADHTVRIWNPRIAGEVLTLEGHSDSVSSVRWNPDGRRIVSAGLDGTVRIWDATRGYYWARSPRMLDELSGRLDQSPSDLDAARQLAEIHIANGDWERAAAALRRWFESPENATRTSRWYATDWWVRGSYPGDLLSEFPPEQEIDPFRAVEDDEVLSIEPKWELVRDADLRYLNLRRHFDEEAVSAYAQIRLYSPTRQSLQLELRADSAARLWLNGRLIHTDSEGEVRSLNSKVDTIRITLDAGWNTLLVKVVNAPTSVPFELSVEIHEPQ